jgi:lipopolysaccharide export system permease protein
MRRIHNAARRVDRKQLEINRYGVEIHKKYSFPAAAFVFILVGAPLGVAAKRGGVGTGAALSFGFFLVHYLASMGGEKMGDRGMIPPWLGMWAINIVLAGAGLLLILRRDGRVHFRRRRRR